MGPEGGERGGEVVVTGPPEVVVQNPRSHTGHHLKAVLDRQRGGGPAASPSAPPPAKRARVARR
jgi:excinuclease ABC subunit A